VEILFLMRTVRPTPASQELGAMCWPGMLKVALGAPAKAAVMVRLSVLYVEVKGA